MLIWQNVFVTNFVNSFAAQNNEELSFVKGERLEILDRPPADPDWYRARNTLGSIGLIPKNYVQVWLSFLCMHSLYFVVVYPIRC